MDNDSTGNLIKGASQLAVALVFGASALVAHSAPVLGQGTWESTLQARDINGNAVALDSEHAKFFYDTALNITWLADWNAGAGSAFDDGSSTTDGLMTWDSAVAWATNLLVGDYGGWRLPTALNADGSGPCSGFNCTGSEMGHMYYLTLGNPADGPLGNTAYFTNMQSDGYWSGTEDPPLEDVWNIIISTGFQTSSVKTSALYAVAVRPGDVLAAQAVPEPGTLALLLAALGVGAVVRRRRAH